MSSRCPWSVKRVALDQFQCSAITGEACLRVSRILTIAAESRAALVDPTYTSGLFAGALVSVMAELEKKKVLVG